MIEHGISETATPGPLGIQATRSRRLAIKQVKGQNVKAPISKSKALLTALSVNIKNDLQYTRIDSGDA